MVIGEVNYPTENILQREEKIQVNDFNSCKRSRSMTASSKRRTRFLSGKQKSAVQIKTNRYGFPYYSVSTLYGAWKSRSFDRLCLHELKSVIQLLRLISISR